MNRRDFAKRSALMMGSALVAKDLPATAAVSDGRSDSVPLKTAATPPSEPRLPDLMPAAWIWYPSARCLANTFVLFRRTIELASRPIRATGWIAADSRYRLEVNGKRIQSGPAPCDPRWAEADSIDLTAQVQKGRNVVGATVVYFGHGDGTWPIGKPGFLIRLEIECADGSRTLVASDASWQALLCQAWKPGQYRRWYLRALQEEFDARLFPHGWTDPEFTPGRDWLPAMVLTGSPNLPSVCTDYEEYASLIIGIPEGSALVPRAIPMLRERLVPASRLAESLWLRWMRPPEEYFQCRPPTSFEVDRESAAQKKDNPGQWRVTLDGSRAAVLTFELTEQIVGWPYFTIEAPAGTVVELLVLEAHQIGGAALFDNGMNAWSRFICRAGINRFECFDFESLRWLQLHIRNGQGTVVVSDVGVRRRTYPWPNTPQIRTSEPALQRLFDASLNTLNNSAQETIVDGMGRERQQYSGDCGHQLHAIYLAFGERNLPARFIETFSQGLTLEGYFLECWPAYDDLARLPQRQLGLCDGVGPLLDHGLGFMFDCWNHYQHTGDLEAVRGAYPRLLRAAEYFRSIADANGDGLLPVENLGVPTVWMDHLAYRLQRHKQCAFNLYAAATFQHALAPLCHAFGDDDQARAVDRLGRQLLSAAVDRFWSRERRHFVNNLPWLAAEKEWQVCDRSLATAVLFDQCPGGDAIKSLEILESCPSQMGLSYPANAGWRLWALGKGRRAQAILKEFRERWATLDSVRLNNTLQEFWTAKPDTSDEWSHCPVAPLYVTFQSLAGIRPLEPGYRRVEIFPQLGDLKDLSLTAYLPPGALHFSCRGSYGARELSIELPSNCPGELILPNEERIPLREIGTAPRGYTRYQLPAGRHLTLRLSSV